MTPTKSSGLQAPRSVRGTSLLDVMVTTLLLGVVMAAAYSNLATQMFNWLQWSNHDPHDPVMS